MTRPSTRIIDDSDKSACVPQIDCIFCRTSDLTIFAENSLALAVWDKYPARPLHMLIIPKRHVKNIFETSVDEREAIHELAMFCRKSICEKDPDVRGFNFGSNVGEAAGQKVFHAHVHLIPRRLGDAELPAAQ